MLDKLESVRLEANVLDTLHYADTLEIEAFLRHFDLSLLRVRPPCDWTEHPDDVASFQRQGSENMMECISSMDALQRIMEHKDADLQVMHYQFDGYEHYDVVHLTGCEYRVQPMKKENIVNAVKDSPLLHALHSGSVADFRQKAL